MADEHGVLPFLSLQANLDGQPTVGAEQLQPIALAALENRKLE
jgi:hypothetical protein